MKGHLTWIAVIVLAVVGPLLATPVAARPKDPDSLQVTSVRQGGCNIRVSFGDPLNGLCPSGARTLTASQPISWHPTEAQKLLRDASSAVTSAGSLQYRLDMLTTMTNIGGGSWTASSTLIGDYAAPDKLRGALTIANPWSKLQSEIIVTDGEAYISDSQTGGWETGLKLATNYYPIILTGCLIRIAESDTASLVLVGTEELGGEPVFHLKGPGGANDELELEYWLGAEDALPRQAIVRTGERPGWSDESHTFHIVATLRLANYEKSVVIEPPIHAAASQDG
jgi:hypothetical protein